MIPKSMATISKSCVPSQETTRVGVVNPGQFPNQNFWKFDVNRAQELDWVNDVQADVGNYNFFAKNEPYQDVKTGMFNQQTGTEPIFGHTRYQENPLEQQQTNAHMQAYKNQAESQVNWNQNTAQYVMRFPAYQYPQKQRWQQVMAT